MMCGTLWGTVQKRIQDIWYKNVKALIDTNEQLTFHNDI